MRGRTAFAAFVVLMLAWVVGAPAALAHGDHGHHPKPSKGCGFANGFLFSRPLPIAGLLALLADGTGALWPGLVGSR